MSTPTEYANAEQQTMSVLLEGLDYMRTNSITRFDADSDMDPTERDLYRALLPELALSDGDDFTLNDVEQAIDQVPLDVEHRHIFDVNLSAQGPTTWLRVEAVGAIGSAEFNVVAVTYHYSYTPEYRETFIEPHDARWRFAVQAVEQQVAAGNL